MLLCLLFRQELIGCDDTLHLPLISASIGVIAFSKNPIAAFYLRSSSIWRKTKYFQGLLTLKHGAGRIGTILPEGFHTQTQHIPQERGERLWRWLRIHVFHCFLALK